MRYIVKCYSARMKGRERRIKMAYESIASGYDELDKSNLQWKYIDSVLKELPLDAQILDIACGKGKYMKAIRKEGFNNVYGLDLIEQKSNDIDDKLISCTFDNIPYERDSFDFCYSISALYYSENPEVTLDEWLRVLKPGGYLVFSGHTKYSIYTLIRVLKSYLRIGAYEHLEYATFYDPVEHKNYLESKGLKVLAYTGFFTSWIDRIMQGKFSAFINNVFSSSTKFKRGYHYIIKVRKSPRH